MEEVSTKGGTAAQDRSPGDALKAVPFAVWLLALAVGLGLASGMDDSRLVAALNKGFGANLGYFAVLLLSSFMLAEAISVGKGFSLGKFGPVLAPIAGAGMVCCDTAYATLSPMAGRYRRQVAVGAYAGFKLLVPAGPLIIGSSLAADVGDPLFMALGLGLAVVATAVGILCLGPAAPAETESRGGSPGNGSGQSRELGGSRERSELRRSLAPFVLLAGLISAGFVFDLGAIPVLKFFCAPIGALAASGALSFLLLPRGRRGEVAEASLTRTASLIFVIGSATCLGAMIGGILPLGALASVFSSGRGAMALYGVCFVLAALFKMLNGSSMATFATVPAVMAPLLAASTVDTKLATYAICLGAFVAVLPNDSFFWITQPSGSRVKGAKPDFTISWISVVQAFAGLAALAGYALLA